MTEAIWDTHFTQSLVQHVTSPHTEVMVFHSHTANYRSLTYYTGIFITRTSVIWLFMIPLYVNHASITLYFISVTESNRAKTKINY